LDALGWRSEALGWHWDVLRWRWDVLRWRWDALGWRWDTLQHGLVWVLGRFLPTERPRSSASPPGYPSEIIKVPLESRGFRAIHVEGFVRPL